MKLMITKGGTMDTNNLLALLGNKATMSLLVIYFINWLKKSKWFPVITYETDKLNHIVAVVLTGLGTLGIHFSFNRDTHTLVVTGLVTGTILSGLWDWLQNYVITKVGYQVLKDRLKNGNGSTTQSPVVSTTVPSGPKA